MLTLGERYDYLVHCLAHDSQIEFAEKTGISNITINRIINGKYSAKRTGLHLTSQICQAFPEVNAEWLDTGDGEPGISPMNETIQSLRDSLAKKEQQIEELIKEISMQRRIIEKLLG